MNENNQPTLISFSQMIEGVEYQNKHTYPDQKYCRMGNVLLTKSNNSKQTWNLSSATKIGKVFFINNQTESLCQKPE